LVRPLRAARRTRLDARAFRPFAGAAEAGMSARWLAAIACLLAVPIAACNKADTTYQGWIEANLILEALDEIGRVQTLSVAEGDTVKTGQPLFTVDDDLQQADLAQVKASVKNAQQTFDRASMLVKTGAGTQK